MTDFGSPIPNSNLLDVEPRFEFSGWHLLIAAEIDQLLDGRSPSWLTTVAKQIGQVLDRQLTDLKPGEIESSPSIARSHGVSSLHPDDAQSQIHDFAALEPKFNWPDIGHKGGSHRWERYAVFALWKIHDAARHLPRSSEPGALPQTLLTTLYEVDVSASLTIEAMRALQIAQALRFEKEQLSKKNRLKAEKSHEGDYAAKVQALELAQRKKKHTGEPFSSRIGAARYIAEYIRKDNDSSGPHEVYTEKTIERWLADEGWVATPEMKAEAKAFKAAEKRARRRASAR